MTDHLRRAGQVAWAGVGVAAARRRRRLRRAGSVRVDLPAADPRRRHRLPAQPDRHAAAAPRHPAGRRRGHRLPRRDRRARRSPACCWRRSSPTRSTSCATSGPRSATKSSGGSTTGPRSPRTWAIQIPTVEEIEDRVRQRRPDLSRAARPRCAEIGLRRLPRAADPHPGADHRLLPAGRPAPPAAGGRVAHPRPAAGRGACSSPTGSTAPSAASSAASCWSR